MARAKVKQASVASAVLENPRVRKGAATPVERESALIQGVAPGAALGDFLKGVPLGRAEFGRAECKLGFSPDSSQPNSLRGLF